MTEHRRAEEASLRLVLGIRQSSRVFGPGYRPKGLRLNVYYGRMVLRPSVGGRPPATPRFPGAAGVI